MSKKSKSSDIALKVENVSKSFHLPNEKANGIKQVFINRMRGVKGYTKQEVLKDISFEVKKGDFFGIVGRNGSGKSTLLKLISQIYTPDSGKITVNGSLVPFIELGVGFNPELTGRENVYLNGAMLGFSADEVDSMYEEIVEFAELHDFMDQKLKNYSSGMQVRLAFSVAIKAQGDILVLDEVLAVGDEAFQRKCDQFFSQIKKDKTKTVVLVTHSMDDVRQYCSRAIMIRDGQIVVSGDPVSVSNEYSLENIKDKKQDKQKGDDDTEDSPVDDFNIVMNSKPILKPGETFEADIVYKTSADITTSIGVTIIDRDFNYNILNDGPSIKKWKTSRNKTTIFRYKWQVPNISDRKLLMVASLYDSSGDERKIMAFTGEVGGAGFLVTNSQTTSKALMAERGDFVKISG